MPSGDTAFAVALDNDSNVYIEYGPPHYPSPGYIEKCPPNSSQCTDLGITLGAPGYNLVVDLQGNIIACDELAATIDVFPPNSNQPRIISQGLNGCPFFALDKQQKNLFVANQSHGGTTQGVISVFDYASGNLVNTISGGIPSGDLVMGVALSPSLR
jgi:DNA-binding beta-propeller fold protein YncE